MTDRKPNRYLVVYQNQYMAAVAPHLPEDLEFDELAWSAEDAVYQSRLKLPGSASCYPILSVEPWTPELALSRQSRKLWKRQHERELEEAEERRLKAISERNAVIFDESAAEKHRSHCSSFHSDVCDCGAG
jgi:hypothetical protein